MKKTFMLSAIIIMALFIGGCSFSTGRGNNNAASNENKVNQGSEAAKTNNEDAKTNIASTLNNLLSESEADFSLNEVLRGVPTLVVGKNNQITGQITVNPSEPAKIDIGEIKLDARTFITDNPMRNKNIVDLILKANEPQNQFIVFKPTNISGVPKVLKSGETFPVTIAGDLTISGTTKPASFTGTITWKDDGTLDGLVESDLTYADFGLALPNFTFFSNVDKVVKLKIIIKADVNK